MAVSLSTGMELSTPTTPIRGGLLDRALELPSGWERGVTVPFYGCGQPIVRDKCVIATDVPHRDTMAEFQPFPIEQGVTCSTIGGQNLDDHARTRLESTAEWAVARQLEQDLAATGNPALQDATPLTAATDVVNAVAVLEEYAANTGFGTPWVLHAPVFAAAYLRRYNLIDDAGRTPAGGTWVISPGYSRPDPATIRMWVTGPVWAGVDEARIQEAVAHRMNSIDAWALTLGLTAFDPCLNASVDVPVPGTP